ncbi:hypothetical protein CYY_007005 [Polysphondylium violaceum]|uniref:Uncharacterized protein n=1 Tax=Polysphondylium violaceum TaxID=133409 RepID=A0A8J4V2L4_9MYCE|nr:hypothetical protein CYY_007005 [Polysphondylium violaceum]
MNKRSRDSYEEVSVTKISQNTEKNVKQDVEYISERTINLMKDSSKKMNEISPQTSKTMSMDYDIPSEHFKKSNGKICRSCENSQKPSAFAECFSCYNNTCYECSHRCDCCDDIVCKYCCVTKNNNNCDDYCCSYDQTHEVDYCIDCNLKK